MRLDTDARVLLLQSLGRLIVMLPTLEMQGGGILCCHVHHRGMSGALEAVAQPIMVRMQNLATDSATSPALVVNECRLLTALVRFIEVQTYHVKGFLVNLSFSPRVL